MTILGYDIDGQPLRAGDRVVLVWVGDRCSQNMRAAVGEVFTVKCQCEYYDLHVEAMERICGVDSFSLACRTVRKLPPKKADNEATTWESIEQLTGWVPEGVRV